MGAKHSLEDDLITFKLTSKQFGRSGKSLTLIHLILSHYIMLVN